MIVGRVRPNGDGVAVLAGLREVARDVRRGRDIIRLVAEDAIRRNGLVRPTGMALLARRAVVATRQREERVIEGRVEPCRDGVAGLAGGWEAAGMAGSLLIVGLVAGEAIRRDRPVRSGGVAREARNAVVASRQREQAVIEGRVEPVRGCVAL